MIDSSNQEIRIYWIVLWISFVTHHCWTLERDTKFRASKFSLSLANKLSPKTGLKKKDNFYIVVLVFKLELFANYILS